MKTKFLSLLGALLTTAVFADPPVDLSGLPTAVQQTITSAKGQGEVKKIKPIQVNGQSAYEVEYKERGDEKRMLVGQDGTLISSLDSQGKGNAKGKGKGKAKGHYKNEEDTSAQPAATPTAPAQPGAPAATPSPAPAATPSTAPATAPATPPQTTPEGAKPVPTAQPAKPAPRVEGSAKPAPGSPKSEAQSAVTLRINRINNLAGNANAAKTGLAAMSKETGVPVDRLLAQQKEYAIGTGGLLVCNEIAKVTKKPASTYIKQRLQGRDWDRIAAEAKFDLGTVVPKLDRVQHAMEATQRKTK